MPLDLDNAKFRKRITYSVIIRSLLLVLPLIILAVFLREYVLDFLAKTLLPEYAPSTASRIAKENYGSIIHGVSLVVIFFIFSIVYRIGVRIFDKPYKLIFLDDRLSLRDATGRAAFEFPFAGIRRIEYGFDSLFFALFGDKGDTFIKIKGSKGRSYHFVAYDTFVETFYDHVEAIANRNSVVEIVKKRKK